jgi:Flp pilus assembly CpaF family ATPase
MHLNLPKNLTQEQKEQIISAVKNGSPIIVCGPQEPTGKTTLVNHLRELGITAYEEWEVAKITLNKKLT